LCVKLNAKDDPQLFATVYRFSHDVRRAHALGSMNLSMIAGANNTVIISRQRHDQKRPPLAATHVWLLYDGFPPRSVPSR
jgi:hypothetical protein